MYRNYIRAIACWYKRRKIYPLRTISFCLATIMIIFAVATTAQAAVVVNPADNLVIPSSGSVPNIKLDEAGSYAPPDNGFSDGNPRYYFVTQDKNKSTQSEITYNDTKYPLTQVFVTNDINQLSEIMQPDGNSFKSNITIFLDNGIYSDSNKADENRFSAYNLSLVGLGQSGDGQPLATLTKSPLSAGSSRGMLEQNLISQENIYFENIVFDGLGNSFAPASESGSALFVFSGESGSTDGFVMKDCVIQNFGSSSGKSTQSNAAISILHSADRHNFENLRINNVIAGANDALVQIANSSNNYFQNLTIDSTAADGAVPILISGDSGKPESAMLTNIFTGELNLTAGKDVKALQIRDYTGQSLTVPSNYQYAQFSYPEPNLTIACKLPPPNTNVALIDLKDNYWVIGADASHTMTEQLQNISNVLGQMATARIVFSGTNIKLLAQSNIDSFTVPDFGDQPVNIVVLQSINQAYSSQEPVALGVGTTIELPADHASNIKLYNIDFFSHNKWSLQQVIAGIDPAKVSLTDPNDALDIVGYPKYDTYAPAMATAAKISGATADTFVNCRFASLTGAISIVESSQDLAIDGSITLHANLTDSNANSYTAQGFTQGLKNTADDSSIQWFSNNNAIASVDRITGQVTALSKGAVTITAKAVDSYNCGEIEKPYATIKISIKDWCTVTFDGNNHTSGKVPLSQSCLEWGGIYLPAGNGLSREGFSFKAWNTKPDGSGTDYMPEEFLSVVEDITLFAHWVKSGTNVGAPNPTATSPAESTSTETKVETTPAPEATKSSSLVTATPTPSETTVTPTPQASDASTSSEYPSTTVSDTTLASPSGVNKENTGNDNTAEWLFGVGMVLLVGGAVAAIITVKRRKR